jgi:Ca2+-binding EF-hand superfamily protein
MINTENKKKLKESFASRYFETTESIFKSNFTNIIEIFEFSAPENIITPFYKPISKIQSKIKDEE